jgi:hypothetical protein
MTTWTGYTPNDLEQATPRRLRCRSQGKATFTRTINAAAAAPGVHLHTQGTSIMFPGTPTASRRTVTIEQPPKSGRGRSR